MGDTFPANGGEAALTWSEITVKEQRQEFVRLAR
jgi:hypothetical protein